MTGGKNHTQGARDEADLDFEALAEVLGVLANGNRLRLLAQLRQARTASEIRLTPETVHTGENPDRVISRQAVHNHLDRLLDIKAVLSRPVRRLGASGDEFVVNHQQIFAISEEFRKLGTLRPTGEAGWGLQTRSLADVRAVPPKEGPHLVLVHGLNEGTVFPLEPRAGPNASHWVIGRRPDMDICLDYDPFVSSENSRLLRRGEGFAVEDLPGSRNGTFVNWQPVPVGEQAPVKHGDVLGVGRTLLLFRER
ncbi:MAG TPA: FHA domain-containing protein [Candidatus Thermoplasmatota archaeon]|nr:FHA domain-containing protein [Candidatus Thermoplasmatota archaeon]